MKNEIKKMQRLAGLITESEYQESSINEAPTEENVKLHWDTMITYHPEDVAKILTDLTTGKMPFNTFLQTMAKTINDKKY